MKKSIQKSCSASRVFGYRIRRIDQFLICEANSRLGKHRKHHLHGICACVKNCCLLFLHNSSFRTRKLKIFEYAAHRPTKANEEKRNAFLKKGRNCCLAIYATSRFSPTAGRSSACVRRLLLVVRNTGVKIDVGHRQHFGFLARRFRKVADVEWIGGRVVRAP